MSATPSGWSTTHKASANSSSPSSTSSKPNSTAATKGQIAKAICPFSLQAPPTAIFSERSAIAGSTHHKTLGAPMIASPSAKPKTKLSWVSHFPPTTPHRHSKQLEQAAEPPAAQKLPHRPVEELATAATTESHPCHPKNRSGEDLGGTAQSRRFAPDRSE